MVNKFVLILAVQGSTLAEISRTVEEINANINERKVRLAPQIKKLRAVRQAYSVSRDIFRAFYLRRSIVIHTLAKT